MMTVKSKKSAAKFCRKKGASFKLNHQIMPISTGSQKVYHVKEHLSAEDLVKRGLAPTLNAMEVEDYMRPNCKKSLCQFLWPNHAFNDIFAENLLEHRKCVMLDLNH